MKRVPRLALVAVCSLACQADSPAPDEPAAPGAESAGSIRVMDAAMHELFAADAVVERVASGFQFTEGPVWVDGALLFSDIPANTVFRWTPDGSTSEYISPVMPPDADTGGQGGSNGLTLDSDGRLLLCEHGNRRLARLEADSSRTTLADRYEGKRLNSPNDAVVAADGSVYFTDPPYGLAGQDEDPGKELDWNGIYRFHPDGTLDLLSAEQSRPNGIALSPDGKRLYVANSDRERAVWMVYDVEEDGGLGAGQVFYDTTGEESPGVPDGMKVDERGNVYGTGPGGVWVLSPEGEHLGTIELRELPANVGWGDDGMTLYMTARTGIYRVRTEVTGLLP